jgi:hypothetical protein
VASGRVSPYSHAGPHLHGRRKRAVDHRGRASPGVDTNNTTAATSPRTRSP